MKYIVILLVSVFLLTGCTDEKIGKDVIITRIQIAEDGLCTYYPQGMVYFVDVCGKFNIGDTIKIVKK